LARVVELSHVGLFVRDLQQSKDFYTRVIGLTVTDENDRFVFLSARPEQEHHELALLVGREAPPGTAIVQQVSFRCPTLADLREYYQRIVAEGVPIQRQTSHVIALGLSLMQPCETALPSGSESPSVPWMPIWPGPPANSLKMSERALKASA